MLYLIGYIVTVVLTYIMMSKATKKNVKDCPGCNYIHCERHYDWWDVFKIVLISLFGPVVIVMIIIVVFGALLFDKKPPRWL